MLVHTICPADTATNPNLSWPALRRPRLPAVALSAGHIVYVKLIQAVLARFYRVGTYINKTEKGSSHKLQTFP
jgi:hypothetical protein